MNPAEVVAITVGAISIATAILGGLVWVIRAQMAMQKEFKPNGGSSARDTLNEIRADVRSVRDKLDDHIDWHMDRR